MQLKQKIVTSVACNWKLVANMNIYKCCAPTQWPTNHIQ
jgi:hypothetical protein